MPNKEYGGFGSGDFTGVPRLIRLTRRPGILLVLVAWLGWVGSPNAFAVGSYTIDAGAKMDLQGLAKLGLNCNDFIIEGVFLTGAGKVSDANDVTIAGTLNGGSGTLNVKGDWTNDGTFIPGTGTVQFLGGCGNTEVRVTGPTTFCNLDLSDPNITYFIQQGALITVNCSLTLSPNPNNLKSGGGPGTTAYIHLGPNATYAGPPRVNNVVIGPAAIPIPTLSGYGIAALLLLLLGLALRHQRLVPGFPSGRPYPH